MAEDARINTALPAHPKTKKLIRRLGPAAGWHLVCLFLWVSANRSDGDLVGMSDEDIELAVDWTGDEGALVSALVEVGFLDGSAGGYSVHDWAEHNPWAAGSSGRSEHSRKAARARWEKKYGCQTDAPSMPAACSGHAVGMQGACGEHAVSMNEQCPNTNTNTNTDQKQKKGRASAPVCPDDVDPQTWGDWLALRKAKRAPVTETVIREARREAAKAGMPFGQFLAVWCRRGSQGLEADWLKPHERTQSPRAGPDQPMGKQMQGIMALEALKRGNRVADGRGGDGPAEARLLVTGSNAGG